MTQYGVSSGSHQLIDIPNPQSPGEALQDTTPTGLAGLNTHELVTNLLHGKTGNLPQGVGMWMIGPDGTRQVMPEEQILAAKQHGFIFDTPWDRKVAAYVRDNDGFGGALKSFGLSGINEALFGLPERLRDPLTQEEHQELNLAHPTAHLFGNIAGIGAQIAATEGLGATAAIESMMFAEPLARGAGLAAGIGREAATSAVMGGLYAAPYAVQNLVLDHNPMAAAEQMIAGVALGSVFGAGIESLRVGTRIAGGTLTGVGGKPGLFRRAALRSDALNAKEAVEEAVRNAEGSLSTAQGVEAGAESSFANARGLEDAARADVDEAHSVYADALNQRRAYHKQALNIDAEIQDLTKQRDIEGDPSRISWLNDKIAERTVKYRDATDQVANVEANIDKYGDAINDALENFSKKTGRRFVAAVKDLDTGELRRGLPLDIHATVANRWGLSNYDRAWYWDIRKRKFVTQETVNRYYTRAAGAARKVNVSSEMLHEPMSAGELTDLDNWAEMEARAHTETRADYAAEQAEHEQALNVLETELKTAQEGSDWGKVDDLTDQIAARKVQLQDVVDNLHAAVTEEGAALREAAGATNAQEAAGDARRAAQAALGTAKAGTTTAEAGLRQEQASRQRVADILGMPGSLADAVKSPDGMAAYFAAHGGHGVDSIAKLVPQDWLPWIVGAQLFMPHSMMLNVFAAAGLLNRLMAHDGGRSLLINGTEMLGRGLVKTSDIMGFAAMHPSLRAAYGRTAPALLGGYAGVQLGQSKRGFNQLTPEENVMLSMRFISQYTGNPQPVMRAVNKFMKQAAIPPLTRIGLGRQLDRNMRYLQQHAPTVSQPTPFSHSQQPKIAPSAMHKYLRIAAAVENPMGVVGHVADGTATMDEIEAVHTLYPMLAQNLSERMLRGVIGQSLPYAQRLKLQAFTQSTFDPAYEPQNLVLAQAAFQPQGQPQPNRGTPRDLSTAYASDLEQSERNMAG